MPVHTCTIGYPRIGHQREAKAALERHWKGQSSADELLQEMHRIQAQAWREQQDAGIELIGADGTLYDHVLDLAFALSLVPKRHLPAEHVAGQPLGLDVYFSMARGKPGAPALDLSKFFDSNYHYLVPEVDWGSWSPTAQNHAHVLDKVRRCQAAVGVAAAVPVIVGPLTLASLMKQTGGAGAAPLPVAEVVRRLTPAFTLLLKDLADLQVPEVQVHEPFLVTSEGARLEAPARLAYAELAQAGPPLHLVAPYDDLGEAYPWAVQLPVRAVGLDFIGVPGASKRNLSLELVRRHGFPQDKRLGAGVVDGRSVWADSGLAPAILRELLALGLKPEHVCVQSSVSLQHLPLDVEREVELDAALRARLGFARQKLHEIVRVAREASAWTWPGEGGVKPAAVEGAQDKEGEDVLAAFKPKPYSMSADAAIKPSWLNRPEPYEARRGKQVQLPAFPTTTIGSFPQTAEVRRARLQYRQGRISEPEYLQAMAAQIGFAIGVQEALGVDVLVHGEAERTDMVEYFAQHLEGLSFTLHGWVQSYGSRYVRPPLVVGDVAYKGEMTVREFRLAQALTLRPVKGMLTGPITILNWSFPRRDISRQEQATQLALALRHEVQALERAGCKVVQVDEPALREGLPLKEEAWQPYLDWAVAAFRLTCGGAAPETQVVTHLCYSDFEDIVGAIHAMDVDVLTIENSRSDDEMVRALVSSGYHRDLGPGVYDVHSPVVPSAHFIKSKLQLFVSAGALRGQLDRLWCNPDCGLKTRGWAEVLPALRNMVEASRQLREELQAPKN